MPQTMGPSSNLGPFRSGPSGKRSTVAEVVPPQPVAIESLPYTEPIKKPWRLLSNKAAPPPVPAESEETPQAGSKVKGTRLSNKDEKAVEEARTQKRAISEEILMGGCVQSFVDFFYLTHRPDPTAAEREDGTADMPILVPTQELHFIKDNLMRAELARRRGGTDEAFEAYEVLAAYYEEFPDFKTAIYFLDKCLEIARLTGDRAREMLSNHRLGTVYDRSNELPLSIAYHEKHRELAQAQDSRKDILQANAELLKVYLKYAEKKEEGGVYDEAIKFFEKGLEASKKAEDVAAEGRACYRLGNAYVNSKSQYDIAIKYLNQYESISATLKDLEGSGKAYEALARAHQRIGDDEKGMVFLENFLKMATSTNDPKGQSDACSDLGIILSRRRQYKMAVNNLQRTYEISRDLLQSGQGSMQQFSEAQIYLGIAKGNAMLGPYISAVVGNMSTLLEWKITHSDNKLSAPVKSR